jgi:Ca2+/H+ antiporter
VKKSSQLSLFLLVICFTALVLPVIYLYARGGLSPRQLGTAFLILIGCLFAVVVFRLRRRQAEQSQPSPQDKDSPQVAGAVRKVRAAVVILPIVLLISLWATKEQPLLPRLVGAAISISITCYLLFLLSRTKRQNGRGPGGPD